MTEREQIQYELTHHMDRRTKDNEDNDIEVPLLNDITILNLSFLTVGLIFS